MQDASLMMPRWQSGILARAENQQGSDFMRTRIIFMLTSYRRCRLSRRKIRESNYSRQLMGKIGETNILFPLRSSTQHSRRCAMLLRSISGTAQRPSWQIAKRKAGRGGHNARPSVATRGIPFEEAGFSRTSLDGKGMNSTRPRDHRASTARSSTSVAQSTQDEQRDRQRRDAYSVSASSVPCDLRCCLPRSRSAHAQTYGLPPRDVDRGSAML